MEIWYVFTPDPPFVSFIFVRSEIKCPEFIKAQSRLGGMLTD